MLPVDQSESISNCSLGRNRQPSLKGEGQLKVWVQREDRRDSTLRKALVSSEHSQAVSKIQETESGRESYPLPALGLLPAMGPKYKESLTPTKLQPAASVHSSFYCLPPPKARPGGEAISSSSPSYTYTLGKSMQKLMLTPQ